jgi:hypothetical protein
VPPAKCRRCAVIDGTKPGAPTAHRKPRRDNNGRVGASQSTQLPCVNATTNTAMSGAESSA